MKYRLLGAILSFVVFAMAAVPAEAAQLSAQEKTMTSLKADAKRVEKLRHGYIKYDGNKMYYYW